ncbi:MAG: hypothetical protein KF901_34085, partial [Myxococcales bacterium]|nr:hypothetical protein [Myxococcales bacterium]
MAGRLRAVGLLVVLWLSGAPSLLAAQAEAARRSASEGASASGVPSGTERASASGGAPLATGPEGWLGTFVVREAGAQAFDPRRDCAPTCALVRSESPRLGLARLAAGRRPLELAFVAHAPRQGALNLLVGLRGRLEVRVDGELVGALERATDREDDRLVEVPLRVGAQVVVLRAEPLAEGPWTLRVRVLDARGRPGPGDVRLSLGVPDPGGDPEVAVDERHELSVAGEVATDGRLSNHALAAHTPVARLAVGLPAGGIARPRAVRVGARDEALVPTGGVFSAPLEILVPLPPRGGLDVSLEIGGARRAVGGGVQIDRPLLAA